MMEDGLAKRALLALRRQQEELRDFKAALAEPVAIVGIGCRFPGGADSPDRFWDLLCSGASAIREAPPGRYDPATRFDWDPSTPGAIVTRAGGYLDDIDQFDAAFFGISPREARAMDPQQRMLLEVAWETLENANIPADRLYGSPVGVFLGLGAADYALAGAVGRPREEIDAYAVSGGVLSVAAGRLAYVLGLTGPALVVDTACSSSLVALHLACRSLRDRECDLALAGGVGLLLAPEPGICFSKARMLAPDGRCKTFDAAADGYGRGEGCGLLALKRLSDARRDGDEIAAVVLASAMNQDGASGGLTVPNGVAQQAVMRAALKAGGLPPERIGYVETHGTGTALGDPIEARAIGEVYGRTSRAGPLPLGALKSVVGHLEAAAGVAGIIKAALAVRHRVLPGNLNFHMPSPLIDWDGDRLTVPTAPQPWGTNGADLAAVSAFGFCGTNAHVIIGPAPQVAPGLVGHAEEPICHLLALSARSPKALSALASRYATLLKHKDAPGLDALCRSANAGRASMPWRLAAVASSRSEMADRLARFASGDATSVSMGHAPATTIAHLEDTLSEPAAHLRDSLERLARDFTAGRPVDWEKLAGGSRRRPAKLPNYPFERERYWFTTSAAERRPPEPIALLGRNMSSALLREDLFLSEFSEDSFPTISDHRVFGVPLVAGATWLSMAANALAGRDAVLEKVRFPRALQMPGETRATVQTVVGGRDEAKQTTIGVSARVGDDDWFNCMIANVHYTEAPTARHPKAPVGSEQSANWIYAKAAANGVELGCSFRWLAGVWRGEGEAWGRLAPPGSLGAADAAQWHPGLIDSCFQTLLAALPEDMEATLVPTQIARVRFRDPPPLQGMTAHLVIRSLERGKTPRLLADIQLTDEAGRTLLEIEGFEALGVDSHRLLRADATAPDDWFYQLRWQAEPEPVALITTLKQRAPALFDSTAPKRYGRALAALDGVAAQFGCETLQKLGWGFSLGHRDSLDGFAEALGVLPRHERLLGRLLDMLAGCGVLRRDGDTWEVLAALPQDGDATASAEALLTDFPEIHSEAELLSRCGAGLAHALSGSIDPISLLFPDGDDETVSAAYAGSLPAERLNAMLGLAVASLAEDRLPGTLRVIELGAGTGATAAAVLRTAPQDSVDYIFTDVAQLFLTRAAARFGTKIKSRLLDIERSPEQQGFAPGDADVVIAVNVLHATRNLIETLRNAHRLLKPGGKLLLIEACENHLWLDLVFGLTDGWWRFSDIERRQQHPLLSSASWQSILEEAGFPLVSLVEPAGLGQALFVAQAEGKSTGIPIVLTDDRDLANSFHALDSSVITVSRADRFAGEDGRFSLNPGDSAQWSRLFSSLPPAPHHVIDLWAMEAGPLPMEGGEEAIEASVTIGCHERLEVVRGLLSWPKSPNLLVATRQAVGLAGDAPLQGLAAAGAAGLVRTLRFEHPALSIRHIDLDNATSEAQARRILFELGENCDVSTAWRNGTRRVARVTKMTPPDLRAPTIRSDGDYLITGGLGGLGMEVAQWLAQCGAGRVLLLGRNAPDPMQTKAIEALRAKASVEVITADVADRMSLAAVIAGCRNLRGVFHAAGTLEDGLATSFNRARLWAALRPKLAGAWILHRLTLDRPLDHFVLFSSAASLLGSAGQSGHAAANAYLDALAWHRRASRLPALSINWGAWQKVGAAARLGRDAQFRRAGFGMIAPKRGIDALARLMAATPVQAGVIALDPAVFQSNHPENDFFSDLAPKRAHVESMDPFSADEPPSDDLQSVLRRELAAVLGFETRRVVSNCDFSEMGLDSLTSLELRNRLQRSLGLQLPANTLLEYPTIETLAVYLTARLGDQKPPVTVASGEALSSLESAGEDEIDALLGELFDEGFTIPGTSNDRRH